VDRAPELPVQPQDGVAVGDGGRRSHRLAARRDLLPRPEEVRRRHHVQRLERMKEERGPRTTQRVKELSTNVWRNPMRSFKLQVAAAIAGIARVVAACGSSTSPSASTAANPSAATSGAPASASAPAAT